MDDSDSEAYAVEHAEAGERSGPNRYKYLTHLTFPDWIWWQHRGGEGTETYRGRDGKTSWRKIGKGRVSENVRWPWHVTRTCEPWIRHYWRDDDWVVEIDHADAALLSNRIRLKSCRLWLGRSPDRDWRAHIAPNPLRLKVGRFAVKMERATIYQVTQSYNNNSKWCQNRQSPMQLAAMGVGSLLKLRSYLGSGVCRYVDQQMADFVQFVQVDRKNVVLRLHHRTTPMSKHNAYS